MELLVGLNNARDQRFYATPCVYVTSFDEYRCKVRRSFDACFGIDSKSSAFAVANSCNSGELKKKGRGEKGDTSFIAFGVGVCKLRNIACTDLIPMRPRMDARVETDTTARRRPSCSYVYVRAERARIRLLVLCRWFLYRACTPLVTSKIITPQRGWRFS